MRTKKKVLRCTCGSYEFETRITRETRYEICKGCRHWWRVEVPTLETHNKEEEKRYDQAIRTNV